MYKIYDILIIGGGISACTFISDYLRRGFNGKIGIIEMGRNLGGRCSSRNSSKNKGWILNHGAPNFNISNKSNNPLLDEFMKNLLDNNYIKRDDSLFITLDHNYKFSYANNNDFYSGDVFSPVTNMRNLAYQIINLNNTKNNVDFFFNTVVHDLDFNQNEWNISTNKGKILRSKLLISASNLIIHPRSKKILDLNQIPLRKAIKKYKNKQIDETLDIVNDQNYIQRINFLIYTKSDYKFKDCSYKKNIHFLFTEEFEKNIGFERIIFQKQDNEKLGIVIHTKNNNFLSNDLISDNQIILNSNLLEKFNQVFKDSPLINELLDYDDISVMRWSASQPTGRALPTRFKFCEQYKIGFCGDWLDFEGFGKTEGAILSALSLIEDIKTFL